MTQNKKKQKRGRQNRVEVSRTPKHVLLIQTPVCFRTHSLMSTSTKKCTDNTCGGVDEERNERDRGKKKFKRCNSSHREVTDVSS